MLEYKVKSKKMKKLTFLLILLLNSNFSNSQTYYPFPDSNAIWSQVSKNIFDGTVYKKRYGLYGDTIINLKTYSKIYSLYDSTLIHPNSTYYAAIREDSLKRVYILFDGLPEIILYDFSLSIGDTVWYDYGGYAGGGEINIYPQNHYKIVTLIDSILLLNNQYRRKITLYDNQGAYENIWVDGIGDINWVGLLHPIVNDVITNGDLYHLACFKHKDEVLFMDNPICAKCFCSLYTDMIKINKKQNEINIYPNPVKSILYIDFGISIKKKLKIELYDVLGRIVIYKKTFNKIKTDINIVNLYAGIYFLIIKDEDNIIYRKKIFVE